MGGKVKPLSLSVLANWSVGDPCVKQGLVSVLMHQEDIIHVSLCGVLGRSRCIKLTVELERICISMRFELPQGPQE